MAQPAHHFLRDFSAQIAEPVIAEPSPATGQAAARRQQQVREEQLQDAYRRGYEDGRNETRAEADTEREKIALMHARELELLRNQLSNSVASSIVATLERGVASARDEIIAGASAVLRPMARAAMTEAIIDDLSRRLAAILADGAVKVHLKGPQHLVDALKARVLPDEGEPVPGAPRVRTQISDQAEIYVDVDGTLIESNIGEWLKQIDEA